MSEHSPSTTSILDRAPDDQSDDTDGLNDDFDQWGAELDEGKTPEQIVAEIQEHGEVLELSPDEIDAAVAEFRESLEHATADDAADPAHESNPDDQPGPAADKLANPKDNLEGMADQLGAIGQQLEQIDGQMESVQEALAKFGEMMSDMMEGLKLALLFLTILLLYQHEIGRTTDETRKEELETDLKDFISRVPDISEDDIPKWANL